MQMDVLISPAITVLNAESSQCAPLYKMSAMSIRPLVIAACAAAVAIARAAQIIRVISDCAAGSVNLPAPAPIFTGGTFFLVIGISMFHF